MNNRNRILLEREIRRIVRELKDKHIFESESSNSITELDKKIMKEQPNTISALEDILNDSGLKYSIKKIRYFGYPQGVKVVVKDGSKQKTIPGNGLVYSILKGWS
jgi:hypothetical protein